MAPKRKEPRAGGSQRESGNQANPQHTRQRAGYQGERPFVVTYEKTSGAIREYGRYADRAEADRICGLLRWAGAVANVIEARP